MSDFPQTAGFVAPEPAELAPLFPGYEIHSLIATGGMGAVYLAVQKSLDRRVALKILPLEFSRDAAFCAGFEAEAKAMARLNHPNLIGVYDFGEVNGMLYIIMEYVAGKSVYHSAYGKAIDPAEVIRLVTGVCHGLAHAHENGIIHRDIKPSNILLDLNAQPKIGDFGLARPIERKIEEGEEIFGTPHYTAPEVVDSPHSVDYRADIFSVGVLLHELLTGKLPADDPRPASLIARCDVRFDNIIRRATQALPAARYSSAAEMAKDLQAIASTSAPKGVRPAGGATRGVGVAPRRPGAPRRAPVVVPKKSSSSPGIFLLLAAIAGVAAFAIFARKSPETPTALPPPAPVATPAAAIVPEDPDLHETGLDPLDEPSPLPVEEPEASPEEPSFPRPPVGSDESREDSPEPSDTAPKYDVASFFDRARKIMQDKAAPILTAYHSNLRANFQDCERSLLREAKRVKYDRERVDSAVVEAIAEWREEGARIPSRLSGDLGDVPQIEAVYSSHLLRQTGIVDTRNAALAQLSGTYILGLEKQIERLEAEDDPGAIKLIQEEIERTKKDRDHFQEVVLGLEDDVND
jgi:serine/threonine protein kinase